MMKIKDALLTQKRELEDHFQRKYIPRNIELRELNNDIIKVIIGGFEGTETVEWYGTRGTVRFIPLYKYLGNP